MSKTNETSQEVIQAHYEHLRTQVKETEQQRDSSLKDFEGLDKSFTDLHQRYLKLKQSSDTQQQVWVCWERGGKGGRAEQLMNLIEGVTVCSAVGGAGNG